ncbi:alpha/beta hydrolase [Rhodococcus sp. AD45-ID]|uniref:Alpha/beta hydrolase n=1 Tax=Rhodococcus globerulus TaxID=33008 RepID=A0ABU4C2U6_RHOGO|nr:MULTISPECIES: alpha/beta hydrolase [Rhodococcus]NRI69479.1 alpha/beta hydrolase [Rhodococcus sp. MS16]KJF20329.1 Non-heme chloroperoxidase [Rhodococcus sp. AD45]MCE4263242.1 alpha/beta hydrolase [Rhodococcus globerulus]MDV6270548.1 alpha/beta hydrolase [Rhodococcus globerulus]PSR41398.1 alpha/beta hydrolase [Rhodococcus sp. AD45-ID]
MKTAGRMSILGGLLSAIALGSMAGVNALKTATRPGREIYADEDFDLMTRDRASVVRTDDGVDLAVREVGPDDAPLTVVFVHGYCLSAFSWHFQRRQLAERWGDDVRMVFYDQRGHGDSGMPRAKSCTVSQLGRDLASVIEAKVPIGPVVLVGHSMGGMTVLALAGQRPEWFAGGRVVGVGLVSTTAAGLAETGLTRNLQNPIIDGFRLAVRTSPGVVQHARGAARVLITPILRAASYGTDVSPRLHELSDGMLDRTSVVTIVNFLRTLELHDESGSLPVLAHTPAVVICGDQDMMIPFASSQLLADALPESELVRIRGGGHLIQLEFPAIVTDAIESLVSRTHSQVRSDVG